jgi:hypothetical protein
VDRTAHHQRRATEGLRLAQNARDQTNKAILLDMAETWAKLAERVREAELAEGSSEGTDSGKWRIAARRVI